MFFYSIVLFNTYSVRFNLEQFKWGFFPLQNDTSFLKKIHPSSLFYVNVFVVFVSFKLFLFPSLWFHDKMSGERARCPPRSRTEPPLWWRARGNGRGPSSAEPSCLSWSRPSPWLPTRTSPWGRGWRRTRTCPRARYRWVRCSGLSVRLRTPPQNPLKRDSCRISGDSDQLTVFYSSVL